MPKVKRKRHKVDTGKDEDLELKAGSLRVYFRNRYSMISLVNDFLLGIVYTMGSIVTLIGWPSIYSTYLFLAGGIFLTMRPILSILRNISIYKDKDYIEEDFVDEEEMEKEDTEYSAEYDDEKTTKEKEDEEENKIIKQ